MSYLNSVKDRLSQNNYPLKFQEKLIKDLKRDEREQKRGNRRLEEIDMSKYEREEKTRDLNESKKEKQIEWKTTHKVEIKTSNNIYYEENKEKIKQRKRQQYQSKKEGKT